MKPILRILVGLIIFFIALTPIINQKVSAPIFPEKSTNTIYIQADGTLSPEQTSLRETVIPTPSQETLLTNQ